jgi:pyruvate/2-oxoglutarate dehydrogenase complex dihydrolipoamide dehydrogenase (E3) component
MRQRDADKGDASVTFDAIVIGAGQAGGPLSYALADKGWNVALVERAQLGGTCVNTGCNPTKTMVASAQVAYYARQAARWGVRTGAVSVDFPVVIARKNKVVLGGRQSLEQSVAARKSLRLYHGPAQFRAAHTIGVNGEELTSEKIFINTGARHSAPSIEGLAAAGYLTNGSIMELDAIPEHLLVLGGGYVGIEFAQMFARFGSQVTILHSGQQILQHEDPEIAGELRKILEAEGLRFLMQAQTTRVDRLGGLTTLTLNTPTGAQTISGTHLLVATGRKPNTDDLGLAAAGIATDPRGFIRVNGRLETSAPGVWAMGDVKGGPMFTHISYNDYQIVWANLMEGKNLTTENRYVPYAVFTDPQLGGVGITEKEARAKGLRLKIGSIPMTQVARAIERDETAGIMKLVVDASNDRILGASILCSEGGEIVQLIGVAMMAGAPYTLLKGAVYIHPTLAEGLWSLMEAVKPVD